VFVLLAMIPKSADRLAKTTLLAPSAPRSESEAFGTQGEGAATFLSPNHPVIPSLSRDLQHLSSSSPSRKKKRELLSQRSARSRSQIGDMRPCNPAARICLARNSRRDLPTVIIPMETYFESYYLPISLDALGAIQAMLRRYDPFCAFLPDIDCYDVLTFRRQKAHHETKTFALFDRNILSDVLSLVTPAAAGQEIKCNERGRIGAAVMCFLQSCNALIEPSISLYENPEKALEELSLFRRADNIDASIYARIALGNLDALPRSALPPPPDHLPQVDFTKPITHRRKLRIAALKIAEIDLSDRSPEEKMEAYLQWTFADYISITPAVLLAATYFTPRRTRPLLRNLRSVDRNKALQGINNAVWDLQVLLHWMKSTERQDEQRRLWILCSRDTALKRIARALHCGDSELAAEKERRSFYEEYWGAREGLRLADLSTALQNDSSNPIRRANGPTSPNYLEDLERDLEAKLLAWRPIERASGSIS